MSLNLNAYTVIWLFTAALASWYMILNLRRAHRTMRRVLRLSEHEPEKYFSTRRFERQVIILFVEVLLALAGVVSLFLPSPAVPLIVTYVQVVIPTILTIAHLGLALFSRQEHIHYHQGVSVLLNQELRRQLEEHRHARLNQESER